jgi:hypothetical protein
MLLDEGISGDLSELIVTNAGKGMRLILYKKLKI